MSKIDLIKNTINETALLNRYLKSRGINPEFVSKDQKVAHSKTNQFKVWMNSHMNDPVSESISQEHTPTEKRSHILKRSIHVNKEIRVTDGHKQLHSEAVDKKDTVTFDIPLLIRVLEFAREELNSDINLHKMVERLISMRGKGTLTMNQYGQIVKEEFEHLSEEQIDEISKELANRYMYSARSDRDRTDKKVSDATEKQRSEFSTKRHKNIGKLLAKSEKRTTGINRALDRLTKEEAEQLDELSPELQHSYFKKAYAQKNDKTVPKATRQKRSTGMNKVINRTLRRNTISTPGAAQDFKDQEAKRGIGQVRDHVEVEGTVVEAQSMMDALKNSLSKPEPGSKLDKKIKQHNSMIRAGHSGTWDKPNPPEGHRFDKKGMIRLGEAKEANYGGDYQSTVLRVKELAKKKPVDMASLAARMQASYKKDEKKVKESLEPMAACSCAGDGANNPDDILPPKSNTAKKVKLLLGGKKVVKEDMYDHEKEDKPVTSPGKKVKFEKPGVDSETRESPQAAAILSGGKTLTGEPRDTIEIDPMMKMKQSSPNSQKTV